MSVAKNIMEALDEQTLADRIYTPIDRVRIRFTRESSTVPNVREFERVIGSFMQALYNECVAPGARLPEYEAVSRAKRMIEDIYRRRRQTLQNAISDCIQGLNGGIGAVLTTIAEGVRNESLSNYMEDVFDRYVALNSFPERVAVIRDLMVHYGLLLPKSVRSQPPEAYAADYKLLLNNLLDALRDMGAAWRRS